MVGMFGQKVSQGQANGPDVELIVRGTEVYATYETPDGFPALYDEALGLFCYARLAEGMFQSTGVPISAPAPADAIRHATEADDVRQRKIEERTLQRGQRSPAAPKGE